LQRVGVEINYTEDIGPHTKYIPTLRKYPDDIIITADDDVYYDEDMVADLYSAYENTNRKVVICREGKLIVRDKGIIQPYSSLPEANKSPSENSKIPFGYAGVLYPPHIFGEEIFNLDAIKQLAPKADDIWFAAMELYYGIKAKHICSKSWTGNADVDRNEEYNESVSGALYFSNDLQNQNDIQWNAVVEYYQLNKKL